MTGEAAADAGQTATACQPCSDWLVAVAMQLEPAEPAVLAEPAARAEPGAPAVPAALVLPAAPAVPVGAAKLPAVSAEMVAELAAAS